MKKRVYSIIALLSLLSFAGCDSSQRQSQSGSDLSSVAEQETIELRDTYTNKFDEEKIPGQWSEYGIGDPFVYRFNGKFYLYCSTKNFETGVRGWVSDDLIHWTQLTLSLIHI